MTKNLKINDRKIVDLLNELEARIKAVYKNHVSRIILFGSYARGSNESDSDIDVMVLLNKKEFDRYSDELADITIDMISKYSVYPSIMVEYEKEYRENIGIQSLYKNIENEGIELYAA